MSPAPYGPAGDPPRSRAGARARASARTPAEAPAGGQARTPARTPAGGRANPPRRTPPGAVPGTQSGASAAGLPGPVPAGRPPGPASGTLPYVTAIVVRLKLALLRNGLRQSAGRRAAFLTSLVLTALFAALQLLGLVVLRGHPHADALVTVIAAVLALGWAVMPLFFPSGDETLDPTRLVMLPLRPGPLVVALLAASLVGIGPLFTVTLVVGSVIAVAHGAAAVAAAVPAVLLAVLLCVALARAVATANVRLLTSRKGRDLALLSGLLIAVGAQCVNLGVRKLSAAGGLGALQPAADVLRWIPPASSVDAVWRVSNGAYGVAAAEWGLSAAVLWLLLWWWQRTLTRLMTWPDSSTIQPADTGQRAGAPAGQDASGPAGRLLRLLPAGRTGTTALRSLRYVWRDPKTKAGWTTSLGLGLLLPVVSAVQGTGSIYMSCWAAGLLGLQMTNQFGQDASAFWMVVQATSSRRDAYLELRGRALALCLIAVPYVLLVVLASAAFYDVWGLLPETLGIAYAGLGGLIATGALSTALAPYSIPQDSGYRNVVPGQSGLAVGSIFATMIAGAVLCAPVLGLTIWLHLTGEHDLLWLVLPLGVAYGAGCAELGLRLAAPRTVSRLPEILAAVTKG